MLPNQGETINVAAVVGLTITWQNVYSYSPCSNNVQCNIAFRLGCTLLNMNIDKTWQLWENTFMAITKYFPKGVLPRKKVALGNCWN